MDQPADGPRTITVDEAMTLAVECIRTGRPRDAASLCRHVLDIDPENAAALHYSGVLAYAQRHLDEAIGLIERSLALAPQQADWHSNLGIVRREQGDLPGALAAFRRAIELDPTHANACNNAGVLLRIAGELEAAEAAYRTAIASNPKHADAYHNLAVVLDAMGRTREAVTAYSKSLTLRPTNPEARRLLALAYCLVGERENAVRVCHEWLATAPGDPIALHTLAACSGEDVPARASDDYVRNTFDSFSTTFEAKLARLDYRAPELVARSLADSGVVADRALRILDAGCGTGLCGPLLAPYAAHLTGIDLSPGMLGHARDKQVYDDLAEAELTAHLQQHPDAYDVVVSADTLVYFGGLDAVTAAAAAALRPGGQFIFTVEELSDAAPAATFAIQPHGRYAHAAGYVADLLRNAGLTVHIDRAELRKEQGIPVAGLVVRGTRMASGADAAAAPASTDRGAHRG